MAKKKQGTMYLLLAAAGIGVFIYSRKKKEDDKKEVVKAIIEGAAVEAAVNEEQAQSGYFGIG